MQKLIIFILVLIFTILNTVAVDAESYTNTSKNVGNYETQVQNPDTTPIDWEYYETSHGQKYAFHDDGTKEYWEYDSYGYIYGYVKIYPNGDFTLISYPKNVTESNNLLSRAAYKWDFQMAYGKSYAETSQRYEYDENGKVTQVIEFNHVDSGYDNDSPFESAVLTDYNSSGQRINVIEYTFTQENTSSCTNELGVPINMESNLEYSIMDHVYDSLGMEADEQCIGEEINYDYFSPDGKVSVKQTRQYSTYHKKDYTEKIEYNSSGKRVALTTWDYYNDEEVMQKSVTKYNTSGYKTSCNSRYYDNNGYVDTNIDYTYYSNNNKVHTKTTTNYNSKNYKEDAVTNTYNSSGNRTQGTTYTYYYLTNDVETKTTTNYDGDTKTSATKTEYNENGEKFSSAYYYSTNVVKEKIVTYYDDNVAYKVVTKKYDKYGNCTSTTTDHL